MGVGYLLNSTIVDELEKAQVPGRFFLNDASTGVQPGMEPRPESFKGADMRFMEEPKTL
jgi:hypothetical protein